jgi:Flp pilus assembly protein TadD
MLFESQSKIDLLKKDLKQIITDDPNNYEAYNALGYSLADHDLELEKAYEYIQKAIELDPKNPAIIDSLGWVQYKLGQYENAAKSFQKALDLDINDPELYIHFYKTLLKLNKKEKAKKLIIKARELFPKNLALSTLKI